MSTPCWRRVVERLPALSLECRVNPIGEGDELFEIGLEVQQHELGVELEAEGVAEGCFEGEAAKIVGRAMQAPKLDRAPEMTATCVPLIIVSARRVTHRGSVPRFAH
jgi:hypothetical protein